MHIAYKYVFALWDKVKYQKKSKKNIGRIMVLLAGNFEINDVRKLYFFFFLLYGDKRAID